MAEAINLMIDAVPYEFWLNHSNEAESNSLLSGVIGSVEGSKTDGIARENNLKLINDESRSSMAGVRSPC